MMEPGTYSANLEEWKPIPGFSGYEASNGGRIRNRRGKHLHRRPFLNRTEKLYVKTDLGRKHKGLFIHRLVAMAFHGPPPPEKYEVDHLNGDGTDNRPENLEWVSRGENQRRAFARADRNKFEAA